MISITKKIADMPPGTATEAVSYTRDSETEIAEGIADSVAKILASVGRAACMVHVRLDISADVFTTTKPKPQEND